MSQTSVSNPLPPASVPGVIDGAVSSAASRTGGPADGPAGDLTDRFTGNRTDNWTDKGADRLADKARCVIETTKPGITRLVTITAGVGYALAAMARPELHAAELARTAAGVIIGTALSAAGANALNMWLERDRDAFMRRTHARPLPAGRLNDPVVLWSGIAFSVIGVAVLWALAGLVPAVLGAACVLIYVGVYTPMKPMTVLNTLVGTVPGALPPMIGAAAITQGTYAEQLLAPAGVALFLLMTVWQIPHFLAIAWMYREDYAAGGHRMLPVVDPTGRLTAWVILATSALLLPLVALPAFVLGAGPGGLSALLAGGPAGGLPGAFGVVLGWPYLVLALATTAVFCALGVALLRERTSAAARRLFIASIMHLPLLLIAMVLEAGVRTIF